MFNEALKLFENYGWPALFFFIVSFILFKCLSKLIPTWNKRDGERLDKSVKEAQNQLLNHQFFTNLKFKLNNEIPFLTLDNNFPVRQKLFRKLLELKLVSIQEIVEVIIAHDMEKMDASQWATFVISEIHNGDKLLEEYSLKEGIPSIVVSKFMVWQMRTLELLTSYVNDLAISTVYSTNAARVNTLLYLLGLQLITVIGDAEKTLGALNGELTGLNYQGEILE